VRQGHLRSRCRHAHHAHVGVVLNGKTTPRRSCRPGWNRHPPGHRAGSWRECLVPVATCAVIQMDPGWSTNYMSSAGSPWVQAEAALLPRSTTGIVAPNPVPRGGTYPPEASLARSARWSWCCVTSAVKYAASPLLDGSAYAICSRLFEYASSGDRRQPSLSRGRLPGNCGDALRTSCSRVWPHSAPAVFGLK
jgi:hypothetical protein